MQITMNNISVEVKEAVMIMGNDKRIFSTQGNDSLKGVLDNTGRLMKIGDYITYPVRSGSYMHMRFARIKDFTLDNKLKVEYRIERWNFEHKTIIGYLKRYDRATIIPETEKVRKAIYG